MNFQLTTLEDKKNIMLNRKEIKILLKDAAGKISRLELINIIAKNFGIDKKKVFPISIDGEKGKKDVHALVFVYDSEELAKKHLPKYRILRTLTKEERKKIIDQEKESKLKAKQSAVAGN
ncbi:MAG: hypothetical protein ACPKQO_06545 [Nitrososphaeraceae archaeon]